MPERYLLEKVVWPLNRSHGHAYNAFKNEMSDRNTVLHELELPQAVHDALFDSIYFEMSKAISKVDPIRQSAHHSAVCAGGTHYWARGARLVSMGTQNTAELLPGTFCFANVEFGIK